MHFLITAGGTREYIDSVRFIGNASSGRMGYALARAALRAGHTVMLITTADRRVPKEAEVIRVESSEEMFSAVRGNFGRCDCLLMAAAVSDYTPVRRSAVKIKKADENLVLRLKPTVDILRWAGEHKRENQVVAGFALEDRDVRSRAERKMREKKLDMIIANGPEAIGAERATVEVKKQNLPWRRIECGTKTLIARKVVEAVSAV